ncbi:fructose-bisphosphatase class II [Candidatus Margulisiibacteriota bacterium]
MPQFVGSARNPRITGDQLRESVMAWRQSVGMRTHSEDLRRGLRDALGTTIRPVRPDKKPGGEFEQRRLDVRQLIPGFESRGEMETKYAGVVRGSEGAALVATPYLGTGETNKSLADRLSTDTMFGTFHEFDLDGEVSVVEGMRDIDQGELTDHQGTRAAGDPIGHAGGGPKAGGLADAVEVTNAMCRPEEHDMGFEPAHNTDSASWPRNYTGACSFFLIAAGERAIRPGSDRLYWDHVVFNEGTHGEAGLSPALTPEENAACFGRSGVTPVRDSRAWLLERPRHDELVERWEGQGARPNEEWIAAKDGSHVPHLSSAVPGVMHLGMGASAWAETVGASVSSKVLGVNSLGQLVPAANMGEKITGANLLDLKQREAFLDREMAGLVHSRRVPLGQIEKALHHMGVGRDAFKRTLLRGIGDEGLRTATRNLLNRTSISPAEDEALVARGREDVARAVRAADQDFEVYGRDQVWDIAKEVRSNDWLYAITFLTWNRFFDFAKGVAVDKSGTSHLYTTTTMTVGSSGEVLLIERDWSHQLG